MGTFRESASGDAPSSLRPMIRSTFEASSGPKTSAFPTGLAGGIVHGLSIALCILAWREDLWPVVIALWAVIIWCNHGALTLLHEAGHGTLWRRRWLNEAHGMLIGFASLIPLDVYRYVHARHHAHLGRERDPEFWPYNLPDASRRRRLCYAWLELTLGWIVTPALYSLRTARSWTLVPRVRRSWIVFEWMTILLGWPAMLLLFARLGWLDEFTVGFLIPAIGAGSFQTIRKFIEHLGMHGDTIMSMTRTVEYRGRLGRLLSRSQLHVDHHGTHHRYARIPWLDLPEATRHVYGDEHRTWPSHLAAIRDMIPHLLDPKVGPQWLEPTDAPPRDSEHREVSTDQGPSGPARQIL